MGGEPEGEFEQKVAKIGKAGEVDGTDDLEGC